MLDGLTVDTEMRWTLLTALAALGAADDDEIDAEQDRDHTATGRERPPRRAPRCPTAEAKAHAWAEASRQRAAQPVVEAVGAGLPPQHRPDLLEPYVEKYHAMLDTVGGPRRRRIVEGRPRLLPAPSPTPRLRDAPGLARRQPEAPAALRRPVAENRDPVARALRAQERDARAEAVTGSAAFPTLTSTPSA